MIMVDETTNEWVVRVSKVYYCNRTHEPVAMLDRPECPVCNQPMTETGWIESAV